MIFSKSLLIRSFKKCKTFISICSVIYDGSFGSYWFGVFIGFNSCGASLCSSLSIFLPFLLHFRV
jgi:hypothetical protein